jgi:hypothetical protein
MRRALAVAMLGAGVILGAASCGAAPPPVTAVAPLQGWTLLRSVPAGFSVRLPPGIRARESAEGPVRARLWSSAAPDGTNFEVASFDLPEPLEPADRRALLERVVVGLSGGMESRVVSATAVHTGGEKSLDLRVELARGRHGAWRIFYAGDRMFQVSAVGPLAGGERELRAFFDSFHLEGERYRAPEGGVAVPAERDGPDRGAVNPDATPRPDAP